MAIWVLASLDGSLASAGSSLEPHRLYPCPPSRLMVCPKSEFLKTILREECVTHDKDQEGPHF